MTVEEMTKLVVNKLEELNYETVIQNPTAESVFPCIVVQSPLINTTRTENGTPIEQRIQVVVEIWGEGKYEILEISDKVDSKLEDYNLVKTNQNSIVYDEITNKNRVINYYEVKYNGIYNSFNLIR